MLEAELGYRVTPRRRFLRVFLSGATPGYLTTIATVTGLLLALPLLAGYAAGMSHGALALLGLLALIPASDLALALINRAVMGLIGPTPLPRLELAEGVPASMRTLVVVPTLLTGAAEIEEHIDRLEVHYLANPDGHVTSRCSRTGGTRPRSARRRTIGSSRWRVDGIARLNARSGPALRRRRALPPAPSPARLERARGHVDGLGAQARQARTSSTGCCAAPPTRRS